MTTPIDALLGEKCQFALKSSLALFGIAILLTGVFGWRLPAFVPMLFSRPFGQNQLAPYWVIFCYPLLLLIFYLTSWFVCKKIESNLISKAIFAWVSLVASVLLSLSYLYVLFLVF